MSKLATELSIFFSEGLYSKLRRLHRPKRIRIPLVVTETITF